MNRGGGIKNLELIDASNENIQDYFQLALTVNTCDAMGANFINTLLESLAHNFKESFTQYIKKLNKEDDVKHFEIKFL